MRRLTVWFSGVRVGELAQDEAGRLGFQYDPAYIAAPETLPISVSLPKSERVFDERACLPFFDGLLPESQQRSAVARTLGVSENNTFSLLDRLGGEVAGALAFLPVGEVFESGEGVGQPAPLENDSLAALLAELPMRPLLAGSRGLRLSLAGAQSKLPVCVVDGRIALPAPSQPTTHILKPAIQGLRGSTENEAFVMTLAAELGLQVARTEARVVEAGGTRWTFLLVERYDRVVREGRVQRLHQEDFCQALGVPSSRKYQSEGGPGFKACFELLRRVSAVPGPDLVGLVDLAVFNAMAGNADAHAKNLSLVYTSRGPRLAPFYDLLCTAYYPNLERSFAMRIGDQGVFERLGVLAWKRFAEQGGIGFPLLRSRVLGIAERTPEACERTIQRMEHTGLDQKVLKDLATMITERARQMSHRVDPARPS